jgi:hypothetical protein
MAIPPMASQAFAVRTDDRQEGAIIDEAPVTLP